MRRILFSLALVFGFLVGCATQAPVAPFSNSQMVRGSYDQVWDGVMDVLATNNMDIKVLAKDSGFLTSETGRFGDQLARCDDTLLHNTRRLATFNVRVQRGDIEQRVTVNSNFRMIGRNTITGYPEERECQSRGVLEGYILRKSAGQLQTSSQPTTVMSAAALAAPMAGSGFADVQDSSKLPASENCQKYYREQFLAAPLPRTFVLAGWQPNGTRFCFTSRRPNASEVAMKLCQDHPRNMGSCKIYAVDTTVVWQAEK